jgi:hypothetical protein
MSQTIALETCKPAVWVSNFDGDLKLLICVCCVAICAAAVVRGQFMPKLISGHLSTARVCRCTPIFGRYQYRRVLAGPSFNPFLLQCSNHDRYRASSPSTHQLENHTSNIPKYLLPSTEVEPGFSTFGGMLVPVLQLISPVCKTGTSLKYTQVPTPYKVL